jgi:hypothetical protein
VIHVIFGLIAEISARQPTHDRTDRRIEKRVDPFHERG